MNSSKGLKDNFISGVFWEGLKRYSSYGISIVVTAILARLLTPEDFGIIAMVLVYNGFAQIFTESGINSAVVQKKELNRSSLSTVFWFSLAVGVVFALLTILLAPLIERFFEAEGLSMVLIVMSIDLFLIAIKAVPYGLLRREFKFNVLAFIELVALSLSSAVAIYLAYSGWGYWALVAKLLLTNFLTVLPIYWYSNFLPKIQFSVKVFKKVLSFSIYIVGFNSINYWARNADNLLIGKYLGSDSLGFYNQAYKLLMLPIRMLTGILNPVMHPIFRDIKDEKERTARNYLRVLHLIASISFPLGVFLFFTAEEIILILWGDQWIPSVPVFKILAILTLFQPLVSTTGGMLMASDHEKLLFKLGIINTAIMVTGMVFGLPYGIEGVAIGYTISYVTMVMPITFYYLLNIIGVTFKRFAKVLLQPLSILTIVLIVYTALGYFSQISSNVINLLINGSILAIVLSIFLYNEFGLELKRFLKKDE